MTTTKLAHSITVHSFYAPGWAVTILCIVLSWPAWGWTAPSGISLAPTTSKSPNPPVATLYPSTSGSPLTLRDAILQTLEYNLDIQISRNIRDQRLHDILFQKAQFDPSVELTGRYDRSIAPLNRPVFGLGTTSQGSEPAKYDQNDTGIDFGLTQRLLTGGTYGLTFETGRNSVAGSTGFLFNPSYESNLFLNLSHPLLRNFGPTVNSVQITLARNSAEIEEFVLLQQIMSIMAQVEQVYWELVFARENLKITHGSWRAAKSLLANNRDLVKSGIMSEVDVLQAKTAVASRVEQIFLAHKTVKDQEDQLRQRFSPSEWDLQQTESLIPKDTPMKDRSPHTLNDHVRLALTSRPEVLQAKKNIGAAEVNTHYAKNQLLPDLSLQGLVGVRGLGKTPNKSWDRMMSTDFLNMGGGLVLSFPLGNRAAGSQYDKRLVEAKQQEVILQRLRQQIILEVKETNRQVETNYRRMQTNKTARTLSEKQLEAERNRLRLGLSTTRSVLEFQNDLRVAQGREWRAILDYNQSLSRLRLVTASVLDHYHIHLE